MYGEYSKSGVVNLKQGVVLVHSAEGVPCLLGEFSGAPDLKPVAILGGRGCLGAGIARHLQDRGSAVFSIDLNYSCSCNHGTHAVGGTQIWEQQFEDLWSQASQILGSPHPLRALITATRARTLKEHEERDPNCGDLDEQLTATLRAPIAAAVSAVPRLDPLTAPSVILLASTNGQSLSHQPLGYHAANAALLQSARYLSVRWRNLARVHCVAIGAIHLRTAQEGKIEMPGVQLADLETVIDFLLDVNCPSLTGEPIILAAGRSSLDATAVHQNRFGDLSHF